MGDLSEHFSKVDFVCRCGKCNNQFTINPALLSKLDTMRGFLPTMKITSGYRCPAHSVAVGGHVDDAHTTGDAVDLATPDAITRFQIVTHAVGVGFQRIGIGAVGSHAGHVHLDTASRLVQNVVWVE